MKPVNVLQSPDSQFSLRQCLSWLDQARSDGSGDEVFSGICTDSRAVTAGSLYIPIRGDRFDGHAFIDQALSDGAAGFVYEPAAVDLAAMPVGSGGVSIAVRDTRQALGQLARGWRNQFSLPLIGVSGSNGKTTVKEMIAAILRCHFGEPQTLATLGNLNNDIGLPLTLFRLNRTHTAAVVELGMNHPGEMQWLASIAQPTIALVNNAQREHQEFLDGVHATAVENGATLAALQANGTAVYPGDDECSSVWDQIVDAIVVTGTRPSRIRFGLARDAGQFEVWAHPDASPSSFELNINDSSITVQLQIDGIHNVRNALAAAACASAAGVELPTIARGLARFEAAAGRMQRMSTSAGAVLIDDTYNANPDSVRAAIDVLAAMPSPQVLVLADMAEVGDNGPAFHLEVGEYASQQGLVHLLAFGPLSRETVAGFGERAQHFDQIEDLSQALASLDRKGAAILVKGSRSMRMERVIAPLIAPVTSSDLPENRDAA